MTLLLLALAWLLGVAAVAAGLGPFWPLVVLPGAGVGLGLLLAGRWRLGGAALVLLSVAAAGGLCYDAARPPAVPGGVALFNDGEAVRLRGSVDAAPEERLRSQRFRLRVESVYDGGAWQPSDGKVLVTTRLFPRYRYGDALELVARLETPPRFEGFDYRSYLARRGVVATAAFPAIEQIGAGGGSAFTRTLIEARAPLTRALERALPEPEAALAAGILLGERGAIPATLTDDFNAAGISHLVAISGYNVTLVAGFGIGALSWVLGRRNAALVSIGLVILFAVFVGALPSILRAAVMGVLMLGASLVGRPGSALTAIAAAGAGLTLWQPLAIDDVAFQLSFAATFGLILLARPIADALRPALGRFLPAPAADFLGEESAVTIAATVAVLPIIAVSFGRVSLVAVPANLLALPAFPLILATSAVSAGPGVLSAEAGQWAGAVAYLPLTYLVRLGRFFADLPTASVELGRVGLVEAALLYAAVATAIALVGLRRRAAPPEPALSLRFAPALPLTVVVLVLAGLVWSGLLAGGRDRLSISILDVGQGDAILVTTPAGHRILIDGGPSGVALSQALGRELPAGVHRIDLVVLSHAQDDHLVGLVGVLDRYEVGAVLLSPLEGETAANHAWQEALAEQAVPVREAVAGEWLDLGEGAWLEVLGPAADLPAAAADLNSASVVLRLVHGSVSFLLTGDLTAEGEDALLGRGPALASTVLKVGHHGSDGSTTAAFLAAVRPAVAAISVGAENPYGHPSPSTELRLSGVPYFRTDRNGRIRFETDGERLWAEADQGEPRLVPRR